MKAMMVPRYVDAFEVTKESMSDDRTWPAWLVGLYGKFVWQQEHHAYANPWRARIRESVRKVASGDWIVLEEDGALSHYCDAEFRSRFVVGIGDCPKVDKAGMIAMLCEFSRDPGADSSPEIPVSGYSILVERGYGVVAEHVSTSVFVASQNAHEEIRRQLRIAEEAVVVNQRCQE